MIVIKKTKRKIKTMSRNSGNAALNITSLTTCVCDISTFNNSGIIMVCVSKRKATALYNKVKKSI